MVKYLYKIFILLFISLFISGCENNNKLECPILNKKNETTSEFEFAEVLQKDFDNYAPNLKIVYFDVLKTYNKTDNPSPFINMESLKILNNEVWTLLIRSKTNKHKYQKILNSIKEDKYNWCKLKTV